MCGVPLSFSVTCRYLGGGDLKADGMATKEMEEKPLEKNQNLVRWQLGDHCTEVVVSLVTSSNHLENTVERRCHSKRYPVTTYPRTETGHVYSASSVPEFIDSSLGFRVAAIIIPR